MQISVRPLTQVRRALLLASAFSACISAMMLALPVFALQLFEAVIPAGALGLLATMAGLAVLALVIAAFLEFYRGLVLLRAGLWIDHRLGGAVLEGGLARGYGSAGLKQQSRAVQSLRLALGSGAIASALELPWAIAACALAGVLHPGLGLACAAALIVTLTCLVAYQFATRGRVADGSRELELPGEAGVWLETAGRHAAEISASGIATGIARRWEMANRRRVAEGYKAGCRQEIARTAARFLSAAGIMGVLVVGGYLAITDALPLAAVVAAVLVVTRALGLCESTVANWDQLRAARRAWRALAGAEARSGRREQDGAQRRDAAGMVRAPGSVRVLDATCAYPGATAPAIAGVNLVIEPGQAIGIVGPTGSGKSALAAAIAGLLPLVSGRIEVDGAPVPNRLIGYVADEPRLIAGSVADNISGFEPSDEIDLLRTAIRAGVQDVLAALPRGYQTDVGIDGQKLPMRVRRAVALARAIHGGPGVLVLDEPGLGLDESGLTRLAGVLEALKREGTSLVLVTAQPRLLALMDSVAVMAHGKVQGVFQNRRAMRPGYPAAGSERGGSDAPRRVA